MPPAGIFSDRKLSGYLPVDGEARIKKGNVAVGGLDLGGERHGVAFGYRDRVGVGR